MWNYEFPRDFCRYCFFVCFWFVLSIFFSFQILYVHQSCIKDVPFMTNISDSLTSYVDCCQFTSRKKNISFQMQVQTSPLLYHYFSNTCNFKTKNTNLSGNFAEMTLLEIHRLVIPILRSLVASLQLTIALVMLNVIKSRNLKTITFD